MPFPPLAPMTLPVTVLSSESSRTRPLALLAKAEAPPASTPR